MGLTFPRKGSIPGSIRSFFRRGSDKKGQAVTEIELDHRNSDGPPAEKRVLQEADVKGRKANPVLALDFPTWKKWWILTVIFIVQISMNFNAAVYANAVEGISKDFDVDKSYVRYGQMAFLITYAFGCEAWAPWSEELGRFWVLQGSLFLVNIWQIPCALAPNVETILASRVLGGLSSAGGSVTLGLVADLYDPAWHQYALAYVVLSSCAGSVVGPIFGGFIEEYCSWHWVFWVSLILGAVAQGLHFMIPETRATILLDREAKRRRDTGEDLEIYGPNEARGTFYQRMNYREIAKLMWRPYKFLLREPIVTFLSLLSGFSDALIFTGLDSFGPVLSKWNFSVVQKGLAFIPLLIGYIVATASFLPVYREDRKRMQGNTKNITPERRLWWLLYLVLLEPLGLFGFAWCSWGPPLHWFPLLFFTCLIGIANLAIYMATIDYMVAAYGPFAASATGGNGFCRDFLAGVAAIYASPMYHNIKKGTIWQTIVPTLILSGIGLFLCLPVYAFYFFGDKIRKRSPYAEHLARQREEEQEGENATDSPASPVQAV